MTPTITRLGDFGEDGHLFSVDKVRYLASCPKRSPAFPQNSPFLTLITIFPVPPPGERVTLQWTQQLLAKYNEDDVFNNAFLSTVVFNNTLSNARHDFDEEARDFLKRSGAEKFLYFFNLDLAPGPYIKLNGELWEAWRLVEDSHETCMVALKPRQNTPSPFERLSLIGQDSNVLSFAIPSRLKTTIKYSGGNKKFSVAGKRILIKDNIHLNGIKTSNGNRAFYETYPAQTRTASCIQKLIDKGVVVIGKTKMSSFGNWEEPIQYTDYPAPWNPRADRYQSPGGSSSGSASAVAAYEWLDIAIGTDTWGSVTRPAHWCGCFGLRPSLGAISADGIVPCVKSWDTPGILARNLEDCKHFAEEWLDFSNNKFKEYPQDFSCLLWPTDFWENFEATEKEMAKKFARNMADKLGVCLREFSFENCWEEEGPEGWRKYSLQEFMKETTQALAYDRFNSSEDFRTKYKEKNRAEPYTSKPNEDTWSIGKKTSRQTRDDVFARISIYQQWFKDHYFTDERKKTISVIIVLPLDIAGPRYRDDCPRDDDPSDNDPSDNDPSDNDPSDNNHRDNNHIDGFSSDHGHRDKRPGEGSHSNHESINGHMYFSFCEPISRSWYPDYGGRPRDRCPNANRHHVQVYRRLFNRQQDNRHQDHQDHQDHHHQDHQDHQNNHHKDDRLNFRRPHQPGINALALGPVMGSPVLTVPIGQIPYHSRVSKRTEQSPFAVALMGSPGTDIKLIDNAIFAMGCLNIPTEVKTGKRMYDY